MSHASAAAAAAATVMPPPAIRMERLATQNELLRGFLAQLMEKDAKAKIPFPFKRLTVDKGPANASLKLGASSITPYVGVFNLRVLNGKHAFVASYPGIVMSGREYESMPFVVPTACSTDLGRHVLGEFDAKEDNEKKCHSDDIVIVGFPTDVAANIMSTPKNTNVELTEYGDALRLV